jgi:thioredoxin-related protein
MRKSIPLSLVCVLVPLLSLALDIGAKLPDSREKLKNVDGKSALLSTHIGKKGTLVIFTCNHCPYAQAWEDRILEIGRKYKGQIGIVLVNPNDEKAFPDDSYESMQKRAKEKNYPVPYAVDATSNLAKAFDAKRTPEAYLFDGSQELVYHGAIDDAQSAKEVKVKYLEDAIESLLKGRPQAQPETKFIGCSIKFRS